ncbi:MAG TPA: hypothetical protein VGN42_12895 [Pirellulales bacterium]|jgi:hypothetical protein|nr:hypothetical protein [Pirellulales bacterium]
MSQAAHSPAPKPAPNSVPDGIAKGILGFALGAGLTFLGMHFYGPRIEHTSVEMSGAPSMGAGGMVPATPSMGGGGGEMGGAGGGGGGAAATGKRDLTALVGKLELLSREDLKLHLTLDADQSAQVAKELAALDTAETLTAEEAQEHLDVLEALLTPQQKAAVDAIGLPRPGGGGGGMGGGGMGAPAPDQNPFAQEANQKRLQDLLGRLKPANAETPGESSPGTP